MKTLFRLFLLAAFVTAPVFLVSCAKEKSAPPAPVAMKLPVKPAPVAATVAAESAPATQPDPAPAAAPAPAPVVPPPAPAAKGPSNKPADHAGRTACLVCHEKGTAGAKVVPANHAGRTDGSCSACHK